MNDFEEKYNKLMRVHSALAEAAKMLEIKLNDAVRVAAILEAEKKQWEQQKTIQGQVIQQALNKANELNNYYLEKIQVLKDEVRRLKND